MVVVDVVGLLDDSMVEIILGVSCYAVVESTVPSLEFDGLHLCQARDSFRDQARQRHEKERRDIFSQMRDTYQTLCCM